MPNAKSYRRTRNLFDPKSKRPFRLSRSRLENFLGCPRCFYMDRRLGVEPPGMPAFTLNSAVDELLKKEFDLYRRKQEAHPLMVENGIDAVPFNHPLIDEWRQPFKGVSYHHKETNLTIFGAVDDIWIDKKNRLYVVDYKATSTSTKITLDGEYRQAYKRQMEIYQWLLRHQGFEVADTGYFVYCNGNKKRPMFEHRLEFDIEIIAYEGNNGWVESAITQAHDCLRQDKIPAPNPECLYCLYRRESLNLEPPTSPDIPSQSAPTEAPKQAPKQAQKQVQGELF